VSLRDQFAAEVSQTYGQLATPELMPAVLVQACTAILPVQGAGLSLTSRIRVPLAASSAMVARAERLQTTLGEGPCLDATASAIPLVVDVQTMAIVWPMFEHEIVAQTPFRSVASIPLRSADGTRIGALDLYSVDPDAGHLRGISDDSSAVADLLAAILLDVPTGTGSGGQRTFAWMSAPSFEHRMNVWIAVGMLLALGQPSNEDALALLRGYAFSHDITLDEVAHQLIEQRRAPQDLLL